MRVSILIACLMCAVAVVSGRISLQSTPQFDTALFATSTLERHQEIVDRINGDSSATWTAGINSRFVGMTHAQIVRLMGVKKTPPSKMLPVKQVDVMAALPETFDARVQWPQCASIGQIRDQSDCGSCWAFGAVEAATDRICIETNATVTDMISANDLLSCCSECGFGCGGGYLPSAWNYLTSTGVVTGGNYNDSTTAMWCQAYALPNCDHHEGGKYPSCSSQPEYDTPKCVASCDANSTYTTAYSKDRHVFASAYSLAADVKSIQTEIYTNGPVEAAFTVYAQHAHTSTAQRVRRTRREVDVARGAG